MSSIVPARVCSQKHESELLLLFGRRPRLMRGEPICADKSGFCPDQGRNAERMRMRILHMECDGYLEHLR